MASFGKWIVGGLGWAFGGPLGAIVGIAIGSLFDSVANGGQVQMQRSTRTTEGDFKVSLLVLIACIMKADGRVVKAELAVVKRFLVTNFGEDGATEALQILKKMLEQEIDETEVAAQIGRRMNYSSKLELLHFLFAVAYSDEELHPNELSVIERISSLFGIGRPDFDSLRAPYTKQTDRNWAYKALEIEPSATDDEIKKAYRRMAMKYHPDKVNDLGEEVKKSATEKFRSVNEAYETLKKERKMV